MIYFDRTANELEKKAAKTAGGLYNPADIEPGILQTIDYQYPKRAVTVELTSDEFTCVCPFSGLPDFAFLTISYLPRKKLVELKSLKYYLYAFRGVKIYNEHAANKILGDLVKVLKPRALTVTAEFTVRGGMANKVTASYKASR